MNDNMDSFYKVLGVLVAMLIGFIGIFFTPVAWGIIVYHLLSATETPTWIWAIFWSYLPLGIVVNLLDRIIKHIDKD